MGDYALSHALSASLLQANQIVVQLVDPGALASLPFPLLQLGRLSNLKAFKLPHLVLIVMMVASSPSKQTNMRNANAVRYMSMCR